MSAWQAKEIPDQTGRTVIVTGGNGGIGLETARRLAQRGATVVLACRDLEKARTAAHQLSTTSRRAAISAMSLDLADLDSVSEFARAFKNDHGRLDLLINNAGVMATPFARTRQGFELQFGTNHLGHFALTGHLMPLLQATSGSRIVAVSSLTSRRGRLVLDDLNWDRRPYDTAQAYADSKLANLLFALELQRRLTAKESHIRVIAAHPGITRSNLVRSTGRIVQLLNSFIASDTEVGALPSLRAATDPLARGGTYWGPSSMFETRGHPELASLGQAARNPETAKRLFDESENLTATTISV